MRDPANDPRLFNDFKTAQAFEQVYQYAHKPLYYFARKFVPTPEDAEDIVAEAFTKFWQKKEGFDNMGSVLSFLYITVKNASLDLLKKEKTKANNQQELIYLLEMQGNLEYINAGIQAEYLKRVHHEIEKLPGNYRKVFELSFLEGLKNAEIAELLNISEKTVKNIKVIVLQRMREIIVIASFYSYVSARMDCFLK